ncbi:MAG: polysaccharide deacetylase family protein [Firmicutes bacterium]|nr:polysaccharide deacetylase family protein [Bacillota bacterium]
MKAFFIKNIRWLVGLVSIFLISFCIGLFIYLTPQIELVGNSQLNIAVGKEYKELGVKARFGHFDISENIIIEGLVDTSLLGEYTLNYSVENFIFTADVNRTVIVVDNIKPEITLKGGYIIKLCPNEKFVEPGYSAKDNYDGDLSKNIVVILKDDQVIYEVKDSSNNSTSLVRILDRIDKENPVIKLRGNKIVYLYKGDKYTESGYTVTDGYDKYISKKVIIKGTVNTNVAGTYKLVYEATDCSGNVGKVTRTIVVKTPPPPAPIPNDGNGTNVSGITIYLTFDDGSSYLTPQILDILKSEGVKGTFFVIGTRRNDAVWNRMVNEGHTIALHTDTHIYSQVYASVTAYYNDLYAVRDKVKDSTGVDSKILRFPGGSSNLVSKEYSLGIMSFLVKDVLAKGFHYFDWNVSSGDTGNLTSAQIYSNVINSLGSKSTYVVLMHDYGGNETTRDALRDIIRYGKSHGYKFSNITMSTPQIHHGVAN